MPRIPVRRVLRSAVPVAAVLLTTLLGLAVAAPAAAATRITVRQAVLIEGGAAVRVTVALACRPLGPNSFATYALTLWQGTSGAPKYLEGFGGVNLTGEERLTCDGTKHRYSFVVRPTRFYEGRTFRVGRAGTESSLQVCTRVTPDTTHCEAASDLVRQRVWVRR